MGLWQASHAVLWAVQGLQRAFAQWPACEHTSVGKQVPLVVCCIGVCRQVMREHNSTACSDAEQLLYSLSICTITPVGRSKHSP